MIEVGEMSDGQFFTAAIVFAATMPVTIPMMPPTALSEIASIRNCVRISRPCAPTAMRVPISRVRSVTLTSMMFMIPMPPTTSEMTGDPAEQRRHGLGRGRGRRRDFFLGPDGEIVVAPFANVMTLAKQRDDLLLRRLEIA